FFVAKEWFPRAPSKKAVGKFIGVIRIGNVSQPGKKIVKKALPVKRFFIAPLAFKLIRTYWKYPERLSWRGAGRGSLAAKNPSPQFLPVPLKTPRHRYRRRG
ncbi:MAG: hypothetical protein IJE17_12215, partial [Clostridia bacterium]|nr:hypothetical protein [Clostridia bacterium]